MTSRLVVCVLLVGGCAAQKGGSVVPRPAVRPAVAAAPAPAPPPAFAAPRKLRDASWKGSFAPDGRRLAFGRQPSGIGVVELATGVERVLAASGKDPAWSPDGARIAYVVETADQREEIWVVSSAGGAPKRLAEGRFPAWSSDGKTIVIGAGSTLRTVSFDGGAAAPYFDRAAVAYPALSADGERLAQGEDQSLVLRERASGKKIGQWPTPEAGGLLAAFSPDGKRIAFGGYNGDPLGLWVIDLERQTATQLVAGLFTMPAFSPDGKTLAFDRRDGGGNELWVVGHGYIDDCLATSAVPAGEMRRGVGACRVVPPAAAATSPRTSTTAAAAPAAPAVVVFVDVSLAPELAPWADRARRLCELWYPVITDWLPNRNLPASRAIKLVVKPDLKFPAFANGDTITFSGAWIHKEKKAGRDDFGMVIHELTHLIQKYSGAEGWLVEGIADYIRYFRFEPTAPRKSFDPNRASYRDGYWTTSAFFAWIEQTHDRAIVEKLHGAIVARAYREAIFREATGKALDDLWKDFVAFRKGQERVGAVAGAAPAAVR